MSADGEASPKSPTTAGANTADFRHLLSGPVGDIDRALRVCLQQPVPLDWMVGFCTASWHDGSAAQVSICCTAVLQKVRVELQSKIHGDEVTSRLFSLVYAVLAGLSHRRHARMSLDVLAEIGNGSVIAGSTWLKAIVTECVNVMQGAYTGTCQDTALCLLAVLSCIDPNARESVYLDGVRESGGLLLCSMAANAGSRQSAGSTKDMPLVLALLSFQSRWSGNADVFLDLLRGGLCASSSGADAATAGSGSSRSAAPLRTATATIIKAGHGLIAATSACTPGGTAVLRAVATALEGGGYQPPITAAALARAPPSGAAVAWSSAGSALGSFGAALSTAVAFAVGNDASPPPAGMLSGFHPLPGRQGGGTDHPDSNRLSRKGVSLLFAESISLLGRGVVQMPRNASTCPIPLSHITSAVALLLASWDAFMGHTDGLRCVADAAAWRGRQGGQREPVAAPPLLKLLLSICSYCIQSWDDAAGALGLAVLQRLTEGMQHSHMAKRSARKATQRRQAKAQRRAQRSSQAVQAATHSGRLTVQGAMLELSQFSEGGEEGGADTGAAAQLGRAPTPREAEFAVPTCLLSTSLAPDSCRVVLYSRRDAVQTLSQQTRTDPAATQTRRTALVPDVAVFKPLVGAVLASAMAAVGLHMQPRQINLSLLRRACQVIHRVLYLVSHTVPRHVPPNVSAVASARGGGGEPSLPVEEHPSDPPAPPQAAAPGMTWLGSTLSSWVGAATAAAAPVVQAAVAGGRSAAGMPSSPPPRGSTQYSAEGAQAAQRRQAATSDSGQGRGSGVQNTFIPPMLRVGQAGSVRGVSDTEKEGVELHPQYDQLMRHVDWVALLRTLLGLVRRCVQLGLWEVDAASGASPQVCSESQRLVQLVFLQLDMLLQVVDGSARVPVFYELLRQEDVVAEAVRAFGAVDGVGADGKVAGSEDIPPRLQTCLDNLQAVLAAMGRVPGIAALRLGAAGSFDGNLTVQAVTDSLRDAAPWRSLRHSDRVMDAYTPMSDSRECPLFEALVGALASDVRASLKLKL